MHRHYILLVHRAPAQVARLVKSLQAPGTSFYLHIDKKVKEQPFRAALAGVENIQWLEDRQTCIWGDSSIVRATLVALEAIVKTGKEGYCVLLSGQDYPLRSNREIAAFLQKNTGSCFLEACALPYKNWNNNEERLTWYKINLSEDRANYVLLPSIWSRAFYTAFRENMEKILLVLRMKKKFPFILGKRRQFPAYLKPYGGSQWWAIPVAMAEALFRFLEQHPDYLSYFRRTLFADEIFFHSVFMHLLEEKGEQPAEPITYADWERPVESLPVTFTGADWEQLKALPANLLFARKFDAESDRAILDRIDQYLRTDGEEVTRERPVFTTAKS